MSERFSRKYATYDAWKQTHPKTTSYTKRIERSHAKHPDKPLNAARGHAKVKGRAPPPPPPTPQGRRYEVQFNISYISKQPHQTRHGNLKGTIISPYPLTIEQIYQVLLEGALGKTTETWIDGVRPNRHSKVYVNEEKATTHMHKPHAEEVRVYNASKF